MQFVITARLPVGLGNIRESDQRVEQRLVAPVGQQQPNLPLDIEKLILGLADHIGRLDAVVVAHLEKTRLHPIDLVKPMTLTLDNQQTDRWVAEHQIGRSPPRPGTGGGDIEKGLGSFAIGSQHCQEQPGFGIVFEQVRS